MCYARGRGRGSCALPLPTHPRVVVSRVLLCGLLGIRTDHTVDAEVAQESISIYWDLVMKTTVHAFPQAALAPL